MQLHRGVWRKHWAHSELLPRIRSLREVGRLYEYNTHVRQQHHEYLGLLYCTECMHPRGIRWGIHQWHRECVQCFQRLLRSWNSRLHHFGDQGLLHYKQRMRERHGSVSPGHVPPTRHLCSDGGSVCSADYCSDGGSVEATRDHIRSDHGSFESALYVPNGSPIYAAHHGSDGISFENTHECSHGCSIQVANKCSNGTSVKPADNNTHNCSRGGRHRQPHHQKRENKAGKEQSEQKEQNAEGKVC
mmetsp:Transcript_96/g.203  ORF Transcript_96/g.203 Transcript_96/m.203 type:complete len:245 (+) Transcript_96:1128-1862(+)